MRAYIQFKLSTKVKPTDDSDNIIKDWLTVSGFHPSDFKLNDETRNELFSDSKSNKNQEQDNIYNSNDPTEHGIEILYSIPIKPMEHYGERYKAIDNAKFLIHFNDAHDGTVAWGLVCIDAPDIIVRLKHRLSKHLERAAEELIIKICKDDYNDGKFEPFTDGSAVHVRAPNSSSNVYEGYILTPERAIDKARKDKKFEINTAWYAGIATLVCFVADGAFFYHSAGATRLPTTHQLVVK